MNQLTVRDAIGTGGGVYLDVPELSHIALALAPVSEGVGVGVKHGLVCLPEQRVASSLMALGHLENLLMAFPLCYTTLDPGQLDYLTIQTYNRPSRLSWGS